MCGIAGIFHFNKNPVRYSDLNGMAESLKHRGPDAGGIALLAEKPQSCRFSPCNSSNSTTQSAHAGFAHRRLSIIDLSDAGIQPMSNTTGELWITYNGELFNYIEFRTELESMGRHFRTATDTEVVLQAYDEWGPGCLDKFNGMWAFAVWDTRRRRLFLARDRFGIKPLYYACKNGRFVFASELKALLPFDWISHDPDTRALADYLVHSRVDCFERTFFKDINRLEPGCFLDIGFDAKALPSPQRWWNLADNFTETPLSDDEAEEQFLELFRSSVKLRLRSDVPIGTCLSGGLDSAAVVCTARPWLGKGNQKTYSAVYGPSFKEDETGYIDEIVAFTGVESCRVKPSSDGLLNEITDLVRLQDEPFGSTSMYAQFKVFQAARNNGTTVTLDGQGADEELAGYQYLHQVQAAGLLRSCKPVEAFRELSAYSALTGNSFPAALAATPAGFFSHRSMLRLAGIYDSGRSVSWVHKTMIGHAKKIEAPHAPGMKDWLNKRLYELFTVSSLPALLRYEDRNSMACSVEARLPFLDHRLVSFIFSLPSNQKIRGGRTKHIMRKALKGTVPESVRTRTDKIGFTTPEADWLRNKLLPYVRDILGSSKAHKRGIFDASRLIGLIDSHASGKIDASRAIWRALNCELWFREFID